MPRNLAAAFCAALVTLTAVPAAAADTMRSESARSRVIFVPRDKSLSFRLERPASKIVVAQPETAEIVATTDRSFYVRGVALGSTNLLVYGPGGHLQEVIDVRVGYDAADLQQDMTRAMPGESIRVQSLGDGLLLTGNVSTTGSEVRAKAIAEKYAPGGVTSMLTIRGSQIVLEVRVLEATRSTFQDFGFGGSITDGTSVFTFGSGIIGNTPPNGIAALKTHIGEFTLDATLQALEEKGLVRTLARPNLVALSGEKASFLAGGEFPYPVPQDRDKITIQFRTYGVKLNFTPVVQDNGQIRLQVEPEVSQLDIANSLRINGVQVPGLITRRVSTTVEIKNGDSLAIGGLFQHDYKNTVRQFPVLGDLPIIGTLFRSARWQRNETELLVIVTPRLVTAKEFETAAATKALPGSEPLAANVILNGWALDKPVKRDRGAPVLRGPVSANPATP